jgi:hypothetical protein
MNYDGELTAYRMKFDTASLFARFQLQTKMNFAAQEGIGAQNFLEQTRKVRKQKKNRSSSYP